MANNAIVELNMVNLQNINHGDEFLITTCMPPYCTSESEVKLKAIVNRGLFGTSLLFAISGDDTKDLPERVIVKDLAVGKALRVLLPNVLGIFQKEVNVGGIYRIRKIYR